MLNKSDKQAMGKSGRHGFRKLCEKALFMNFTIMLVPHSSQKKPIHFKIPVWVILGAFTSLFTLLCFTSYFAYSSHNLRMVEVENARLEKISAEQENQLSVLELFADNVLAKLTAIDKTEAELREKVGLAPKRDGVGGISEKYYGDVSKTGSMLGDPKVSMRLSSLDSKMHALLDYSARQCDKVDTLVVDINDRLDYLASVPCGWPISDVLITSGFGARLDPFTLDTIVDHSGLDLSENDGAEIFCAGKGIVVKSETDAKLGNYIIVDHGYGYQSLYAHCRELLVSKGAFVKRGDLIALVGSTGNSTGSHLHFGITCGGKWIDPLSVLDKR
ncbi:MAG: M23 family metallopeptidase [Oscillospiraceae bacterium]